MTTVYHSIHIPLPPQKKKKTIQSSKPPKTVQCAICRTLAAQTQTENSKP